MRRLCSLGHYKELLSEKNASRDESNNQITTFVISNEDWLLMAKNRSAHRFRDSRNAHVLIEYVRSVYCKCAPCVRTQYLKDKANAHTVMADR